MRQTYQVVLLKSNKPLSKDSNKGDIILDKGGYKNPTSHYVVNLYIISDAKVTSEDTYIIHNNEIDNIQESVETTSGYRANCKKIIATTAELRYLVEDVSGSDGEPEFGKIPQIPKDFIEYYISEYNQGNKIEEVELEFKCCLGHLNCNKYGCKILKLTSNNEVIIANNLENITPTENVIISRKEYEELYTKKEVIMLIENFAKSNAIGWASATRNNWLKDNLKK